MKDSVTRKKFFFIPAVRLHATPTHITGTARGVSLQPIPAQQVLHFTMISFLQVAQVDRFDPAWAADIESNGDTPKKLLTQLASLPP